MANDRGMGAVKVTLNSLMVHAANVYAFRTLGQTTDFFSLFPHEQAKAYLADPSAFAAAAPVAVASEAAAPAAAAKEEKEEEKEESDDDMGFGLFD